MGYFTRMFTKVVLGGIIVTNSLNAAAQAWQPLGSGVNWQVMDLFADTIEDVLYVGGGFTMAGDIPVNQIAKWNCNGWDSVGSGLPATNVLEVIRYNGNIYGGGSIGKIGANFGNGVARWDGANWESVGSIESGGVWGFLVENNKLYAMGNFDSIAGIPASKIAVWNDTVWSSLPVLDNNVGGWAIGDGKFYQGELYVGGNFPGTNGPNMSDIAIWDGVQWKAWGTGLSGLNTGVNTIAIYNDDIYIGGYFFEVDGDPGNCIARWNGSQWDNVGGGVNSQVFDLLVYNNELYVGGTFSNAGGIPVTYLAKWDGNQWYDVDGTFDNGIGSLAVLNDELYAGGGFWTVDGDSMSMIAKYGTNPCDTTGIGSLEEVPGFFNMYPNPASDQVTIQTNLPQGDARITIYNILGKPVHNEVLNELNNLSVDLSTLSGGIYLLQLEYGQTTFRKKLIKQ